MYQKLVYKERDKEVQERTLRIKGSYRNKRFVELFFRLTKKGRKEEREKKKGKKGGRNGGRKGGRTKEERREKENTRCYRKNGWLERIRVLLYRIY